MLETTVHSAPSITTGAVDVIIDNIKVYNEIGKEWKKTTSYVSDASSTILRIKQLIETSPIDFNFELITNYKKEQFTFKTNPKSYLMKNCDREAKY